MRAWVLHKPNEIRFEEVKKPEPKSGEVLVAVTAVGVCGSDIPRIYRTGAHRHPLIPGHEFSGEVVAVGAGVDSTWQGKRVGIFPLIPCTQCPACKKRHYELCRNYDYLGSRRDGGFAEYVAVPAWNLLELPAGVSSEAAAMMEPMAVAVHAMRRIEIRKEDNITVCGLGTIGLLLVMFLREAGYENIYVIGNKDFQKRQVLSLGVREENYCDGRVLDKEAKKEWVVEKTGGTDVFFECVGKNETLSFGVDTTASFGRIVTVGNPYSDMTLERDVYWKILRNQLLLTGTWNSSYTKEVTDDWNYVLNRLRNQAITPEQLITHRLSLPELERGLHVMRDKTEDYAKVMAILGE